MSKHVITILFLVAAGGFYMAGLFLPATALLVIGLFLEGIFWVRFLRGIRSKRNA